MNKLHSIQSSLLKWNDHRCRGVLLVVLLLRLLDFCHVFHSLCHSSPCLLVLSFLFRVYIDPAFELFFVFFSNENGVTCVYQMRERENEIRYHPYLQQPIRALSVLKLPFSLACISIEWSEMNERSPSSQFARSNLATIRSMVKAHSVRRILGEIPSQCSFSKLPWEQCKNLSGRHSSPPRAYLCERLRMVDHLDRRSCGERLYFVGPTKNKTTKMRIYLFFVFFFFCAGRSSSSE